MNTTPRWRCFRLAAALIDAQTWRRRPLCLVRDGRIVQWLEHASAVPAGVEVEEAEGELWVAAPGLLHAHLESFDAPAADWPRTSFAAWAASLLRWRVECADRLTAAQSAQASFRELQAHGCGFLATSVSEPGARIDAETVRSWPELFEPDPAHAEAVWRQHQAAAEAASGVALHAPFSVSLALARRVAAWTASAPARRCSIHLGEHQEERAFLAEHAGPLAELFRDRGRPLPTERFASPVDWLDAAAPGLQPQWLAVHAGTLSVDELQRLHRKRVAVVWCPGTHEYFQRARPAFAEAGLPAPVLGCDSRASNASLNPLRELALARKLLPSYGPQAWWQAGTVRAAQVMGWGADRGSLYPGRLAQPLRLQAGELRDAAEACDWLTSAMPTPLAAPGLPATKRAGAAPTQS